MSRKPENKKKAEFAPNTTYVWEPDQEFLLTGAEIQKINNAFMAVSNTPEFQRHAVLYEGIAAFSNFFKEAVEDGLIKPQETEVIPPLNATPKKAWHNDEAAKESKGLYSLPGQEMKVVREELSKEKSE